MLVRLGGVGLQGNHALIGVVATHTIPFINTRILFARPQVGRQSTPLLLQPE